MWLFDDFFSAVDFSSAMIAPYQISTRIHSGAADKKSAHFELPIPGVKRESILVKFVGNLLKVTYVSRDKPCAYQCVVPKTSYNHSLTTAKYEDGVLYIDVPVEKKSADPEFQVEVK